jgi:hypothetical protein
MVLGSGARDRPSLFVLVDFGPMHSANLVPTLASKREQFDNAPVIAVAARGPNLGQFTIRQDPLP